MGSFEFKRIGVSKTETDKRLKAQLLECLGVDLSVEPFGDGYFVPSFNYDDILIGDIDYYDREKKNPSPDFVFALFNKLFGCTNVYYEDDYSFYDDEDPTGYYVRNERIYNASSMIVSIDYIQDDYGECENEEHKTEKIKLCDIRKDLIVPIIEKSTKLGYTELTALILDRFKDILGTDLDNLSLDDK